MAGCAGPAYDEAVAGRPAEHDGRRALSWLCGALPLLLPLLCVCMAVFGGQADGQNAQNPKRVAHVSFPRRRAPAPRVQGTLSPRQPRHTARAHTFRTPIYLARSLRSSCRHHSRHRCPQRRRQWRPGWRVVSGPGLRPRPAPQRLQRPAGPSSFAAAVTGSRSGAVASRICSGAMAVRETNGANFAAGAPIHESTWAWDGEEHGGVHWMRSHPPDW